MTQNAAVETLRRAFIQVDEAEAERIVGELPEIPPLGEGETLVIMIPQRRDEAEGEEETSD